MKFNKMFSMMLVGALALSVNGVVNASTDNVNSVANTKIQLTDFQKNYAYLYEKAANAATKKLIQKARREVIYGNVSWTVGGKVFLKNSDGTIKKLPEFKDLFPGWNLKELSQGETYQVQKSTNTTVKVFNVQSNLQSSGAPSFQGNVYMSKYSNQFYQYNYSGSSGYSYAWACTLPVNTLVNIGFKNLGTNIDLGWVANLPVYTPKKYSYPGVACDQGVRYGVRCSISSGTAGTGVMEVNSQLPQ
jgi:hypothetical protein